MFYTLIYTFLICYNLFDFFAPIKCRNHQTTRSLFGRQSERLEDDLAGELNEDLGEQRLEDGKLNDQFAVSDRAIEGAKMRKRRSVKEPSEEVDCRVFSSRDDLTSIFAKAVQQSYPGTPASFVSVIPCNAIFGDYQCNAAMLISKTLKSSGKKLSPQHVARDIIANVSRNDIIEKIDVAGPGFINIRLSRPYLSRRVLDILVKGFKAPTDANRLRVVVDFSSPNVAKEMHVGHLRSTIIGDSICNLLESLGHEVLRLNHVGDWGTQFGMLIAHLQDTFPNYVTESLSVNDLQRLYRDSKLRFDGDEDFKKRAYECVVRLQKFDERYMKGWELICNTSRKAFQKIYDRLNVRLTERGESFYQMMMNDLVKELEDKRLLEDDEGRKLMWAVGRTVPLTIVKSDGGFTYDTSDLAAMKHRIEVERADRLIYVVDEGQAGHFETVIACAELAGILDPTRTRVDFVGFGVVLGENRKKFKTRSGDVVRLVELLDEGLKRSLEKLKQKKRDQVLTAKELKDAQEAIAYGCIKYADLSHNRKHAYVFSFDKMLDDKGNTAVYLLYTYVRIASIARNANVTRQQMADEIRKSPLSFEHDKEIRLAKTVIQFYDVIQITADDLCMHRLCDYLYDLSTKFSEFYDSCYVIEKGANDGIRKIHVHRLVLCEVTALVMEKCFDILGLKTVKRL